ncbi:hypothetical protein LCGC14_1993420, partial [marine sediment metagenome]
CWHRKIPMYVVCHNPKKDWNMWMLRTVRSTGQVFDSWVQLTEFLEKEYTVKTKTKTNSVSLSDAVKNLVVAIKKVVQALGKQLRSSK